MAELQTVETLNCLIERTETPPFYRLTSMRKASSHSDGRCHPKSTSIFAFNCLRRQWTHHIIAKRFTGPATGANDSRAQDLTVEKGTIHTKRHSGEDPIKTGTCKSDSGLRAFSTSFRPPRGSDKIRALSGPSILPRPEDMLLSDPEVRARPTIVARSLHSMWPCPDLLVN